MSELRKTIEFYIQKQGQHRDNKELIALYDNQIEDTQKKIKDAENKLQSHSIAIEKLKKRKKLLLSVAEKIEKVSALTDYDDMRTLVLSVLSKIIVYNPDTSSSIIKIEYVNGESDSAVYSPTRLKKRFIFLSQDYQNRMKMHYEDERKSIVFDGYYLGIGEHKEYLFNEENDEERHFEDDGFRIAFGTWDTPKNRERIEKELNTAIENKRISEAQAGAFRKLYADAVEQGLVWKDINHAIQSLGDEGITVYKDEISVTDYINLKKNSSLFVYDYEDLQPMTERGIRKKNWHREYYKKKYNSGKPTFTEFVEKGADYDRINKERKHLYNRKYKILNNKHLTAEQKEEKIMKIMEQLEAFKYQLKYLPNNKKGEEAIKKYNGEDGD